MEQKRNGGLVLMCAFVLAAFAFRLHDLGARSLWEDEGDSFFGSSWSAEWTINFLLNNGVHPPLYYFIQKVSYPLGASEFAMRWPAAMFGVLSVAAIARLGREWMGWGGGALAAIFAALSPFAVAYGREARMYSLLVLLAVCVMMEFWRLMQDRKHSARNLAVWSAMLYFTHYFSLFIPPAQFLYLVLTFRRNYPHLRQWTAAQAVAFVPVGLWLFRLYSFGANFKISWIKPPPWYAPLQTLPRFVFGFDGAGWPLMVMMLAALVVAGLLAGRGKGWPLLLAVWMLLPPSVAWVISLKRPLYIDRYLIEVLPAVMLAMASAVLLLFRQSPRVGALANALVIGLMGWQTVLETDVRTCHICAKENWRGAAAYIDVNEQPGDTLLIRSIFNFGMNYYYHGQLQPQMMDAGWQPQPPSALAGKRVWVVYRGSLGSVHSAHEILSANFYRDEKDATIRNWLSETRPYLVEWHDFDGVVVMVYDFSSAP